MKMATRWGIVSAGNISEDFCTVLNTLPKEEHQIVAVAARNLDRAREFAAKFKIPKVYGSYADLANDKDVEIAYIGTIHPEHLRIGKMMLQAGKHVLVEKSICMNSRETKELLQFARSKNLFLMEGVWTRFFPVFKKLREELNKGIIGEVVHINISQGFAGQHSPRIVQKQLGGGALLDIGVYCVNTLLYILEGEKPQKFFAVGQTNDEGVDIGVSASFLFSKGRTANFALSTVAELPCELIITGTKGHIKVLKPFWCPTRIVTPENMHEYPIPEAQLSYNFINSAGLRYEAMEVRECLKKGLKECPIMPHKDSETTSEILTEIRRQIGVSYPADKE